MTRRSTIALSALTGLIVLLLFLQTPVMKSIRGFAWNTTVRTVGAIFNFDIEDTSSVNDDLNRLTAENTRLKAELADYKRLKLELGSPSVENLRTVSAVVVSRPLDTLQSKLILSRGSTDGIAIGDPVVVNGSVLIGTITAVQAHSAELTTLFSPESSITAEGTHDDEEILPAQGLVKGVYYSSLLFTTVPKDTRLQAGQSVVSATDDTKIPHGLVIGTIESVSSKEFDAYQEATIIPPYDIDTIRAVVILTQP